jgi:hypothetical protein
MFGSSPMTAERDQPVVRRLAVSSPDGERPPVPRDYRRYRYRALTAGCAVTLFVRVDELA